MHERQVVVPSDHLTVVDFGDGVAVYDAATETTFVLGPLAGWLVTMPRPSDVSALVEEFVAHGHLGRDDAYDLVRDAVTTLNASGLVNRSGAETVPAEAITSSCRTPGLPYVGAAHQMLERIISFRSNSESDLVRIDQMMGAVAVAEQPPTDYIDVEIRGDGRVIVEADGTWDFPSWDGFAAQLHHVVGDYPVDAQTMLCLHAGAVRTPNSEIIVVAGESEAGKSTMVAALVAAGCDYLGDEHVGVLEGSIVAVGCPRPLRLDARSRQILGIPDELALPSGVVPPEVLRENATSLNGPTRPVSRIILPRFDPDAAVEVERLLPVDALKATAGLVFNLGRAPGVAMRTLAQLCEQVPFEVVRYPGVVHAVERILSADRVR